MELHCVRNHRSPAGSKVGGQKLACISFLHNIVRDINSSTDPRAGISVGERVLHGGKMLLDSSRDPHDCSRLISRLISRGRGASYRWVKASGGGGGAILSTLTRRVIRLQETDSHTHTHIGRLSFTQNRAKS